MAEPKQKKPKFKYTRELVRIATDDGMTQKEIGDLCRVEQSVVSGWLNGKSRAFEHQMAELKKRYGNRLNRTTSRVYLGVMGEGSDARWEDSERARRLIEVRDRLKREEHEHKERMGRRRVGLENSEGRSLSAPVVASADELQDVEVKLSPAKTELRELQELIIPGESQAIPLDTLIKIDKEEFEAARRPGLIHCLWKRSGKAE